MNTARLLHASAQRLPDMPALARGEVSPQELDALCLGHIARFKRPRRYRFVASLPKNNYGKVLKTDLRKLD